MLGGDITIRSQLGAGSTFTFTVATGSLAGITMCREIGSGRAATAVTRGSVTPNIACRILLAEDGADNQRLLSFVLQKAGARVTVVDNGRSAVDMALQATSAGSPFDVILMDMQMPVMDGYEAVQRLRSAGYSGPIVALTAHSMPEERDRCLAIGCDEFQGKPVNREMLLETVRRLVAKGAGSRPG
jgi:CheY-like chemotaxis protein